jgi:hypothetical protein
MEKKWAGKTQGGPSIEGCEVRNIRYGGIYGHTVIEAEILRLGQWRKAVFYRDGRYAGMDILLKDRSLDLVEVQHDAN